MAKPFHKILKSSAGITLIETMVAFILGAVIMLALMRSLSVSIKSSVNSKEQIRAGRLAQTLQSRLANMPFDNIVTTAVPATDLYTAGSPAPAMMFCDSSLPNFGMRHFNLYKSSTALLLMQNEVQANGLTRFAIYVQYVRRNSADTNSSGDVVDYMPVEMVDNGDRLNGQVKYVDRYDQTISMVDYNGDGDFDDTYTIGGITYLESPNTHLKQIMIRLWKGKKQLMEQQQLLNREKMSGQESASTENPLKLIVSKPPRWSYVAEFKNPLVHSDANYQGNSFNLSLTRPYVSWEQPNYDPPRISTISHSRNGSGPLLMEGYTEAGATLQFWMDSPYNAPPYDPSAPDDTCVAGFDGHFACSSQRLADLMLNYTETPHTSDQKTEGWRNVTVRAVKNNVSSPYHYFGIFLDINPPDYSKFTPANSAQVHTLFPAVYAVIDDTPLWSGWEPSHVNGLINQGHIFMTYNITRSGLRVSPDNKAAKNNYKYVAVPDDHYTGKVQLMDGLNETTPKFYLSPFYKKVGTSYLPLLQTNDQVTIYAEAADNSHYGIAYGESPNPPWTFTVSINQSDSSPPTIKNPPVYRSTNTAVEIIIEDLESGINPFGLQIYKNGGTKVLDYMAGVFPTNGKTYSCASADCSAIKISLPKAYLGGTGTYTFTVTAKNNVGLSTSPTNLTPVPVP